MLTIVLPIYEEVYAQPPYREGPRELAEFADRYRQHEQRPGFRLVLADHGETVVGFAYGYALRPEYPWWSGLLEPMPPEFTREDGRRTFAILELAVCAPWRGRGVASGLHALLLKGVRARRITLMVRPEPEAAAARTAYAAWGYRRIGSSRSHPQAPVYDAMLLDATLPESGS
jgi:GNAT superfamily N-acetyltransferase